MKYLMCFLVFCSISLGYGYWDVFDEGGRVNHITPLSAVFGGAVYPGEHSAFCVFSNPAALSGLSGSSISVSGWGTGWREEVYYSFMCAGPYRFNKGGLSPRGSVAAAFPLGKGFTAGLGFAAVAQYDMKAVAQVYFQPVENSFELYETLTADGSGDQYEALVSLAGVAGNIMLGVSPGIRFGNGEITVFSDRASGSLYDSTFHESWETAEFALRAGASTRLGYTDVYSTFVNAGERYKSYLALGAAASFPFLNGGFLGTELGVFNGNEIKASVFSRLPWIVPGANGLIGVNGYRPEGAYKMGMGISVGLEYDFGASRVCGAYSWNSRYREGNSIPIDYINWVYDSGESFILGYELNF